MTTSAVFELQLQVDRYLANLTKADSATQKFDAKNKASKGFDWMDNGAKKATASLERTYTSAKRTAPALDDVAKKAADTGVKFEKLGFAVAASGVAFSKYIDFLKSGSGEGSKAIAELEGAITKLGSRAADTQANAMLPLTEGLLELVTAASESKAAATGLGLGFTSAINPALGLLSAVLQLNSALRENKTLGSGRDRAEEAFLGDVVGDGRFGPGGLNFENAAAANRGNPNPVVLGNGDPLFGTQDNSWMEVTSAEQAFADRAEAAANRRRGGGGGGGGDDFGRIVQQQFNEQLAARQAYQDRMLQMQKEFAQQQLDMVKAAADAEKSILIGQQKQTLKEFQAMENERLLATRKNSKEAQAAEHARVRTTKELAMQEMEARAATVQAAIGFAGTMAKAMGASKRAEHLFTATSEGIAAGVAWAKVANPIGGQIHIPEALAHSAMVIEALAAAAAPMSPRGTKSGGGGGGGGGGAAPGIGNTSMAPAGGGGGGGQRGPITINMPRGLMSGTPRQLARELLYVIEDGEANGVRPRSPRRR